MLSALFLATAALAYSPVGKPTYNQVFDESYNVLKYTGNAGPFSTRRPLGLSIDPPEGCAVDQVVIYMRHGERYPDLGVAKTFQSVWEKIDAKKGSYKEELEFANYWVPFVSPEDGYIAQESTVGAYSGLNTGYVAGLYYAERYGHLWDSEVITPVFTSGYERVVDTARRFIEGFFGYNTSQAALNIIPEVAGQGANSLVPVCQNSSIGTSKCSHPSKWDYPPFHTLANKWNSKYGLNLTWNDIVTLAEATAFELNVRSDSPWVKAIPMDVWIAFEHYLSSSFWCNNGPGAPDAIARGGNFINASRTLLLEGPGKGLPISLNFAHDVDIAPAQAALGLDAAPNFNDSFIQSDSGYHLSDVMPMGGRLVLERLVCSSSAGSEANVLENVMPLSYNNTILANATNSTNPGNYTSAGDGYDYYVRVLVNEAVVPLDACQSGPGLSCPLQEYSNYVDDRLAGHEFSKVCNLTDSMPKDLSFWWNYNTTTELNAINSTVAYQVGPVNYLGWPISA